MFDRVLESLIATSALAAACAVLSIVVVLRRWAFAAEGIGHSAFGGAGTAWLLALLIPSLDRPVTPYIAIVIFCIATALLIGRIARKGGTTSDASVGVLLVASLAWGFLAQQVYYEHRHAMPPGFEALLFGRLGDISRAFALAAVAISALVILVVGAFSKEIIAYCYDPLIARTSGIRTNFIEDVLMILLAMVVIVGARVVGSVLVVALLVLPSASALAISRRLPRVVAASLGVALIGSIVGVLISLKWRFIPTGPAIVLVLFVEFVAALLLSRSMRSVSA